MFRRILKFGWQRFTRNKGLGFQVIFVMVVAIFTFTGLIIFNQLSDHLITKAKEKVDVSVYFKKGTDEERIINIKENVKEFSNKVKNVNYISEKEARQKFLEVHKNDELYIQALEKVKENPFLPSLEIETKSPDVYAKISDFLTTGPFSEDIKEVSYYKSEDIINNLFTLTSNIKKGGFIFSGIMVILVFFITFNTVKLTIFAFKDEISNMRLVGASSWFVRGPFLIQGILYGFFSIIIVDVILWGGLNIIPPGFQDWTLGFDLLKYFQSNFLYLLGWQAIFAFVLGSISSLLAVRKHLKV